ncbi:hypothetical protein NEFER03_1322 [Nematocida sp. LUAm3]|nr:hypothetical protein NEFER03_1322 [Nematocida sp. LUAm3]KAI5174056.1 hypothetical protein NEFER02_0523 [Nematocida sp. LUAm2]KAI5177201.1 hypothetical protein NEFER01_0476 [Nematocida sp. LUAm1]
MSNLADTSVMIPDTIYRVQILEIVRSMFKSLYLDTEVFLGLRTVEIVFLGFLMALAIWKLGKMFMYSRVYKELFKGLKGEYGSAIKEGPEMQEQRKAHIQAIENAFLQSKTMNDMVKLQGILRAGFIQEQVVDKSKIDASKAISLVIKESNSKLVLIVLGIFGAVIFASKGLITIDNQVFCHAFTQHNLITMIMIILQVILFAIVFIFLLLILIDRKGTLIKIFINSLLNISSSGLFTIINPLVNKIVNIVRDLSDNIIVINVIIAIGGIIFHGLLAGGSLMIGATGALLIGGIFISNLTLFIVFNLFYIIIMEYDLEIVMNLLAKFKDSSTVQKFASIQWLLIFRGIIYIIAITLCVFLLMEPTRIIMANLIGGFFTPAAAAV